MKQFGYLVDLEGVQFHEDNVSWIQAFPKGKWNHPLFGEIKMDDKRVKNLAENVANNVRGQDLNIDYDHKPGEAAGWVKAAEARPDGLWLMVEWTADAASKIKSKVYRYFSPEYADEWEEPRTKKTFNDVLFGGGITNRPFLKGILPLNLSEAFVENEPKETGENVDPKLLRQALNLSEDATDEQVSDALSKLSEEGTIELKFPPFLKKKTPQEIADEEKAKKKKAKAASELEMDPAIQKLAETDPMVKGLVDRIAVLEGATRLSEVELGLKSLDEPGAKTTLSPAIVEQAKAVILNSPRAVGDEVMKLLKEIQKSGLISLGEQGRQTTDGNTKTATQQFMERSDSLAKSEKISLSDAMTQISSQDPALFEQYRSESYIRANV